MTKQPAGAGPHMLRRINDAAVVAALRAADPGGASVAELAAATGLSRPSVTRALNELRDRGLLAAAGTDGTGRGRPARRERFHSAAGLVAGVDIGPHKVLILLADLAGRPIRTTRVPVPPQCRGERLLALVEHSLNQALIGAGRSASELWAVSAGTPGIVDESAGLVLRAAGIADWAPLPVAAHLRERLRCPVLLDNDVTLAVLAERDTPGGDANENLVLVHWGERIGAGIVIAGRPYRGSHGAAGELGFVDLMAPATGPVGEGRGAFERLVGAQALRRLAGAAYRRAGAEPPGQRANTLAELFAAASGGDPVALDVVDQAADRFTGGLAALLLLLDPDRVVIGGGLSSAGPVLLDALRHRLDGRTLNPVRLQLSVLGDCGVALGAVRRALESVAARLTGMPDPAGTD
ncbi:ROK family protein [Streptomyces fildesensis]|uniref:ROK family protein n=1 Tax=Streptomyces fildesensis TaxID=375757 RepID=A0ABW8CJ59_9ACTN